MEPLSSKVGYQLLLIHDFSITPTRMYVCMYVRILNRTATIHMAVICGERCLGGNRVALLRPNRESCPPEDPTQDGTHGCIHFNVTFDYLFQ